MKTASAPIEDGKRPRGRPRELSRTERETAILDAAERLMMEKGLHAASMAAIARTAGMSKRTLYDVFDSRAALFEAWVRRLRTSFIRPLTGADRDLPLTERLHRLLSPEPVPPDRETPLAVLRAVVLEASRHPELGRVFLDEGLGRARSLVRDELDRAVQRGEVRLADTGLAARLLCDMAYDNPIDYLLDPARPSPSTGQAKARLELATRLFLRGAEVAG